MSKKLLIAIIVLVAAAVVILGIKRIKHEGPGPTASVKLGAIVPMTGGLAWFGENAMNAGLLLQEDMQSRSNAEPLEIQFFDSKSNPKDGLNAYHRMRLDGISMFYVSIDPIAKAIYPKSTEDKTLMFVCSVDNDFAEMSPNIFRIYYGFRQQNEVQLKFIRSFKPERVAMLLRDVPHIRKYAEEMLGNALSVEGIKWRAFAFGSQRKDFKDLLAQLFDFKPDVILMSEYGMLYPTIFRQLRELRTELPPVVCGLGMMNARPQDYSLYEGVYFAGAAYLEYHNDPFKERFVARFGKQPSYEAYYAYDSLHVLAMAATKANTIEGMRDWILKTHLSGVSQPEISFNEKGDLVVAVQIYQIRNGKVIPVEAVE
jgi:branched-chain amino acid transport system substrate-binding protein